ncbi:NRDE family protein [Sporosarcina highlanderae]|uniref:NRDE family protein n=1 Tax=Sporosarcina highlanderae TaxID=3035916 RepID=A0ABT8JUF5_9BACL|nr:NRDE family protein [Sporosarcina highlanderae]MDN4608795.1 NRDE family protein [Sporosarcina highlanderae]
MCLINFHYQEHPIYKLIVAANRDEFYQRPTAPAHFWEDKPHLLAGRDLSQHGTWLGITKNGRFAALTNFRDHSEQKKDFRSRGEIVTGYLDSTASPDEFLKYLQQKRLEYAGFNVIVGTADELFYYSNIENEVKKISPGTHGLCNHFLNTPWPKVVKGKMGVQEIVEQNRVIQTDELFDVLQDAEPFPDEQLPDTGVGAQLERALSSLFIKSEGYGTRSSTVLLIDMENNVTFVERIYRDGEFQEDRTFTFKIK